MKTRFLKRLACGAMLLLAGALLTACGGPGASEESAQKLEYPGLHWNDTPEAVIQALDLEEEPVEGEDGNTCSLLAEEADFFGGQARVLFRFMRSMDEGDAPYGLSRIEASFSEGTDMDAVLAEMTRLYGEGSQTRPSQFDIREGELVDSTPKQSGISGYNWPGQEPFNYILDPNEHTLYWGLSGQSAIPEGVTAQSCAPMFERGDTPVSEEVVSQWLEQTPMVELYWTDAYVLEDRTTTKANYRVMFNAETLVFLAQNYSE